MSTYLLLRNNKESGPHSLGDLINAGLKPYDLVWVEGKSAAWRYPGEIEELKPYAPAVEEQPYDRFFKKPIPAETEKKPSPIPSFQPKVQPQAEDEKEDTYSRYMPAKAVAVTMPASGASRIVVQRPAARVVTSPPIAEEKKVTLPAADTKAELDVKFSQPLDDIKEQYIKTLQNRKERANRQTHLLRYAKIAAIIIGLIGSGVAAGYFLSGKKESIIAAVPAVAVTPSQEPAQTISETPVTEEQVATIPQEEIEKMQSEILPQEKPKPKHNPSVSQEEIQKETNLIVQQQKKEKVSKDKNSIPIPVEVVAETNILNGDRNKKVRDNTNTIEASTKNNISSQSEETVVKKSRKVNSLEKYVSVSANNYIKVAFGGIRNLELTVTNDSKFVLDNVTVELQYLKPSEQPLRTEMIEFRSIGPNESITKRIQDTNRGINVNYKIVDISSVQSETASAGF